MAYDLPFPSLIDYSKISVFLQPLSRISSKSGGMQALADTLQSMSMPSVGIINVESMREEGTHVYDRFFSYFRNPEGVASGMLIEASLMMEKHGVLHLR